MTDEEINVLVAEKVMGWTKLDRRAMGWGNGPLVWSTGNDNAPTFQWFIPANEIGHAWRVVEKMRQMMWTWRIQSSVTGPGAAEVSFWQGVGFPHYATAESAPRAICIAALRAVGVEVEG